MKIEPGSGKGWAGKVEKVTAGSELMVVGGIISGQRPAGWPAGQLARTLFFVYVGLCCVYTQKRSHVPNLFYGHVWLGNRLWAWSGMKNETG